MFSLSRPPPNHTRPSHASPNPTSSAIRATTGPSRQQHYAPYQPGLNTRIVPNQPQTLRSKQHHPHVPVPHALPSAQTQRRVTDTQQLRVEGSSTTIHKKNLLYPRITDHQSDIYVERVYQLYPNQVAARAYNQAYLSSPTQSHASAPTTVPAIQPQAREIR
jgi:hypothetical protein